MAVSPQSFYFRLPVKKKDLPNYFEIVKDPIDLQTIKKKVDARKYHGAEDFEYDIRLLLHNAYHFNGKAASLSTGGTESHR